MSLYVYLSNVNREIDLDKIYSETRKQEINNTSNIDVKSSKYSGWLLLQKAVKEVLNLDPSKINFTKDINNKWICKEFYFSLSHTNKFVAVAVSDQRVGIDIEEIKTVYVNISQRILTSEELEEFTLLSQEKRNDYLLEKWTQKEALFKYGHNSIFEAKKLDTITNQNLLSTQILNNNLVLSICSKNSKKPKIIFN
ncbi:4'-phosphopantetheinyl transferase psf-1 [Mycoplasmopsis californica]|uniref:4'-phosphopantetheinyl transferase superfamily protein n=1 Tax=Mycoplasmopsis equigenitalium TaxID=114883 RepID=A0ABY5J5H1_9BACT|nr:4'-phosphopantetheinyl transferase superfamily protein [Mycoplasmopsis equigenitalium]UUD36938.1 4'-phosphopantetheinyl transferase superfamily protein [Mycoplasmopsis equigenitalium]VEU69767.1 4'-phosphopantetheinyl transferase psf-1 [Mycoplasmopsis californica]